MDRGPRDFLIVFRLSTNEAALITRLKQHVPVILKILERISVPEKKPLVAFRSKEGELFGYFVRSKLPAPAILSQIESPGSNELPEVLLDDDGFPMRSIKPKAPDLPSPTNIRDQIFIVEVTPDFFHRRFEGLTPWFLRGRG
jgi:hypothetical protein